MLQTPFDVPQLVKDIQVYGATLSGDEAARRQCLAAARSLSYALETPNETIARIHYAELPHQVAIHTGIEMGLFKALDNGTEKPVQTSELSMSTGADVQLLGRLLKHLAAMGTIYEVEAHRFLPTPFSKALTQSVFSDGFEVMEKSANPAFQKTPEFLSKTGCRNPENPIDCPFQLANNTRKHLFQWFDGNPRLRQTFNNYMTGSRSGLSSWMDKYPLDENLTKNVSATKDAIFFVDVGGGNGHDLQELCSKYPVTDKRMILQEQASIINDLAKQQFNLQIELMVHDFFQEQPIKGARVYYMRRILHDWPDEKCLAILANLKTAMIKGYSRLLIYENVIPNRGAQATSTGCDLIMMSIFAAVERTEGNWISLLARAGFRIFKIWPVEPASESLIEAEIA